MKSKTDIILETANFYNSKNRAHDLEEQQCYYIQSETGNRCAVGRCILDDVVEVFECDNHGVSVAEIAVLEVFLKPEYKGHKKKFWQDLQVFHDYSCNWNETGLTATGQTELKTLLKTYEGL